MAGNTATGAENTHTITSKNQEHKDFYMDYLQKCRYQKSIPKKQRKFFL